MDFLEAARKKRKSSFRSVKSHADDLGMTQSVLSKILSGERKISDDEMDMLYEHFDLEEYGVEK